MSLRETFKGFLDFRLFPIGYNGDAETQRLIFGSGSSRLPLDGVVVKNGPTMSDDECIAFLSGKLDNSSVGNSS